MSLVTALIFIAHPIQTQAVTYTVQRSTSMAAMFYLASVLFYLKARIIQQRGVDSGQWSVDGGHPSEMRFARHRNEFHGVKRAPRLNPLQGALDRAIQLGREVRGAFGFELSAWFLISIICGMLAFLSKQNTGSLPGVILLSEYLLTDRTWEGWKRKIPRFCLVFALWALFILYISGFFSGGIEGRGFLEDVSRLAQETENVSRWNYLCTQFNVLVIYIRLLFLPIGQNLDYLYPFKTGFFDGHTPLAFAFLVGVIAIGIWNIRKRPVISFGIFWFFITLSVESSIIPIRDAMFEHRLYLPMFGFALVVSYMIFNLLSNKGSWVIAICICIVVSFGVATYLRNRVWKDEVTLWYDVVSKSPKSYRAHNNLGDAILRQGRDKESLRHFSEALRIKPEYALAHENLAVALEAQGRANDAIAHYHEALRINPYSVEAHINLGCLLVPQGKVDEAISHFSEALQFDPDNRAANYNLSKALEIKGKAKHSEEVRSLREALRNNPEDANAHHNLANIWVKSGNLEDAITHYTEAIRISSEFAGAQHNLGIALKKKGRYTDAIRHFSESLRIKPDSVEAHFNAGDLLMKRGDLEEAIGHFKEALRIKPEYALARYHLENALKQKEKSGVVSRE